MASLLARPLCRSLYLFPRSIVRSPSLKLCHSLNAWCLNVKPSFGFRSLSTKVNPPKNGSPDPASPIKLDTADSTKPDQSELLKSVNSIDSVNPETGVRSPPLSGILAHVPKPWVPYLQLMRVDQPAGTWLLLSPCMWAITMAAYMTSAPILSTVWMLSVFSVGAFVMRGAGCTINDLWDRDLDNKVGRTLDRPITSGRVSVPQAITFLGAQCLVGLFILLQLPSDCFLLGASSLILVATYPLFKRFTYYPQAVLGACFNWGALLGFPAMGVWNWWVMIPLYLSGWCWTMHYDTIYGHQDKKFDVQIGIKSTALAWGKHSKQVFVGLATSQISLLTFAGLMAGMGPGFYTGVAVGGYRLFRMIRKVDLDNPASCGYYFVNNIKTGHVFWLGILVDYILRILGYL